MQGRSILASIEHPSSPDTYGTVQLGALQKCVMAAMMTLLFDEQTEAQRLPVSQ